MPKENLIFKLDNLEYQYHYLKGSLDSFQPRLSNTSKSYNAKGKKTSKRIAKLLNGLKLDNVERELDELRLDIFQKKVYHLDCKLRQYLEKQLSQYKHSKKAKNDFTTIIQELGQEYGLEHFAELVSKSKAVKLSLSKIHLSTPPKWLIRHAYWQIYTDKRHEYNPSRVWNEVILKKDGCNQLLSSLMNNDKCKKLITEFNSSMDMLLGIHKDKKEKGNDLTDTSIKELNIQNGKQDGEDQGEEADESSENSEGDEQQGEELDEEILKQYDQMLAASDEEDGHCELDPNVDYNEVTDDEPSDDEAEIEDVDNDEEESDDEESPKKRVKYELPELMGGYYSGGDSDSEQELANDKVANKQISTQGQRKNRRGQRARRKIWEQKFGNKANHVVKERKQFAEKREKKQKEFEERAAKRSAKAAAIAAASSSASSTKSGLDEKSKNTFRLNKNDVPAAEHPSWIAKREAEAKLKNAKFEGKKVKFD